MALLVLSSTLAAVALPALSLVTPSSSPALEACQSCEGCEDGKCDDTDPLGADHCCPTSCLAHAVWTFPARLEPPAPMRCEDAEPPEQESPQPPAPGAIDQPPQR